MTQRKSILLSGIIFLFISLASGCGSDELSKADKAALYDKAALLLEAGKYSEVLNTTWPIRDYNNMAVLRAYCVGMESMHEAAKETDAYKAYPLFSKAYAAFKNAGDYKDARQKAQNCLVESALDLHIGDGETAEREDLNNLPEHHKKEIIGRSLAALQSPAVIRRKGFDLLVLYKDVLTADEKKKTEEYALSTIMALFAGASVEDEHFAQYGYVFSLGALSQPHNKSMEELYQTLVKSLADQAPEKRRKKGGVESRLWLRAWYDFIGKGFTFLGGYKDSPALARKAYGHTRIEAVDAGDFIKNQGRDPSPQRDKTIIAVYSQDDKIFSSLPQHIEIMRMIKNKAAGDIFYTKNQSEASLILYISQSYKNVKTLQYKLGDKISDVQYLQKEYAIKIQNFADDKNIFENNYAANDWSAYEKVEVGINSVRMGFSVEELNAIANELYQALRNNL